MDDNSCPRHQKPLREGKYGKYCATPVGTNPNTGKTVFCDYKPGEETNDPSLGQIPKTATQIQSKQETREGVDQSVWELKDLRIAREAALHAASRNHAGKEFDPDQLILEANEYVQFIYKGLLSKTEDVDDSDLPF